MPKKLFNIKVEIIEENDFGVVSKSCINIYTHATSLESAINNARDRIRRKGYKIDKNDSWANYDMNTMTYYKFSDDTVGDYIIEDDVKLPSYDELPELIEDEDELERAQELYEYDDEEYHIPDMNRDELTSLINNLSNIGKES